MARIAFWDRPIRNWRDRTLAWAHMLLPDHGLFRVFYLNLHTVSDDLWRSAQPTPHQLAHLKKRGIRTIVNLRGGREHGSWQLEQDACQRLGLTLTDFVIRSRGAPDPDMILKAQAFFRDLTIPALIHCKSGADRAGFMAVLYLILRKGERVDDAMRHLSWRYGHFSLSKTGILDAFFLAYARDGEAKGLSLPEWVTTHYDPEILERDFHSGAWSSLLVDTLLRRE
jgi:protein tyrosine/serine phosphatase